MSHLRYLIIITFFLLTQLVGCSVNPFSSNNEFTGTASGTLIGAAAGAGVAALVKASPSEILLSGLAGGALGYYVTSLPFVGGGVTHVGGKVYTLGEYVTIEIPSHMLFDVNTSDFLPEAPAILNSAVAVLNRYPHNNIMISGNTSGYYSPSFERKLSEDRARQIAAYLWAHGISNDSHDYPKRYYRDLSYVGYGNHFPISNNITAAGVRENSRIQITSYPFKKEIEMNKCSTVVHHYSEKYVPTSPTSTTLTENHAIQGDNYIDQSRSSYDKDSSSEESNGKTETWDEYINKHPSAEPMTAPIGCSTRRNFKDD